MAVANRDLMRAINRFEILHTIRAHERISRVDIARRSGLSQASVTGITASLIKEGLLLEAEEGKSIGGRRPMLLSLNPDGAFAVGVHLSINQISVVVVNLQAAVVSFHNHPLSRRDYRPEDIADKTVQAVQACMWEADFSKQRISGIGIAIPGLVDSQTGLLRFLPNYQWENVNLRDIIRDKINHPTYIENSANTLAIAEQWFGEGRGVENFAVITLEYGVGMGIVINGQLYRGSKGIAGEFGHSTVYPDGPVCRCGKRGCLEALVGNNAIIRDAKAAARKGEWVPENLEKIKIREILDRAKKGEACLREIYGKAGRALGIGIANIIEFFDPAKIIISGRGVEAGYLLLAAMHDTLPRYISAKTGMNTELVVQNWDSKDYARGAGAVVLQEIYRSPANRVVPII